MQSHNAFITKNRITSYRMRHHTTVRWQTMSVCMNSGWRGVYVPFAITRVQKENTISMITAKFTVWFPCIGVNERKINAGFLLHMLQVRDMLLLMESGGSKQPQQQAHSTESLRNHCYTPGAICHLLENKVGEISPRWVTNCLRPSSPQKSPDE